MKSSSRRLCVNSRWREYFNTCRWSRGAASSHPVPLSSACQNMIGAWKFLAPSMWCWLNQPLCPASQRVCLQTSPGRSGILPRTLLTRRDVSMHKCFMANGSYRITTKYHIYIAWATQTVCTCTPTYQDWAPRRPATSHRGWNLSAGTWASARTRCGCVWRQVPWEPVCASHLPGTHGWGFPRDQSGGRSWPWLWRTWCQQRAGQRQIFRASVWPSTDSEKKTRPNKTSDLLLPNHQGWFPVGILLNFPLSSH